MCDPCSNEKLKIVKERLRKTGKLKLIRERLKAGARKYLGEGTKVSQA